MLIHELLYEEMLRERRESLERLDASSSHRAPKPQPSMPLFVRSLIPGLTHGLLGIPAPPRPAGNGC